MQAGTGSATARMLLLRSPQRAQQQHAQLRLAASAWRQSSPPPPSSLAVASPPSSSSSRRAAFRMRAMSAKTPRRQLQRQQLTSSRLPSSKRSVFSGVQAPYPQQQQRQHQQQHHQGFRPSTAPSGELSRTAPAVLMQQQQPEQQQEQEEEEEQQQQQQQRRQSLSSAPAPQKLSTRGSVELAAATYGVSREAIFASPLDAFRQQWEQKEASRVARPHHVKHHGV
jgi:hypothetical protein